MTYGAAPVLNGVVLRRPSAIDESPEAVRNDVVLAGGSLRSYSSGIRFACSLSWNRLTESEVAAVRSALSSLFVPYTHADGTSHVVSWDPPSVTPIAGTDPTLFAVSLTVKDQSPS